MKNLLEEYLSRNISSKYKFGKPPINAKDLLNIFEINPQYLSSKKGNSDFLKEFPKEDHKELIEIDDEIAQAERMGKLIEAIKTNKIYIHNMFLNFNYTPTINNYLKLLTKNDFITCYGSSGQIQIHGNLNDLQNTINFDFGDEMDEDYKSIENLNVNEFFENLKLFNTSRIQIIKIC